MVSAHQRIMLLGPQPRYRSLTQALLRLQRVKTIALITAGWEEDEDQDHALRAAIQSQLPHCSIQNLSLFERSETLFQVDQDLIQGLQSRQDELRHLRDVYRVRLESLLVAARKTLRRDESLIEIDAERESAIEMIRQLDRQYFVRTTQICDTYDRDLDIGKRPRVEKHRIELQQSLSDVDVLVIGGGHAAIILNRLRVFGILDLIHDVPIIAWSGGAMALAEQVVFYHDSPPQGPGNAEVLRAGIAAFTEVLPLPDADRRLKLKDPIRVSLFARRFDRYHCVILDESSILEREAGNWKAVENTRELAMDGRIVEAFSC